MSLKRITGYLLLIGFGLWLQAGSGLRLAPDEMNYHDFAETEAALVFMDNFSEFVKLETIGYSYDYRYSSTDPTAYPIYAIRISADTPASSGDRYDRNGVLFDCACHAREWLTSESCLLLAQYLVNNRTNAGSGVPELLQYADVWVIPMVTPSGRIIDDTHSGDPTQFFQNADYSTGWRNNGDTRLCDMGVNPARNFSSGFNDKSTAPYCSSIYRGFAPFSTSEANALREFVENHTISFAVTTHSNGQEIWNQWDEVDDAGERMINAAAEVWRGGWLNPSDQTLYDLDRLGVGRSNGQFSAWLADPSEFSGDEIDESVNPWANPGDLPVAGDFDSDGEEDDVAVYRTASGGNQYMWYYDWNHNASSDEGPIGPWAQQAGDKPFAGDFDSDHEIDDVAIFRPSNNKWYFDYNHNGVTDEECTQTGAPTCYRPFAIDYDRDGEVDDSAAFCTTNFKWYYDVNHDCSGIIESANPWGAAGDLPIAGDFDADGWVDDVALYRPSSGMWYYDLDHTGNTDYSTGPWGTEDGLPIAGDFNSDGGVDDVGLFNPSTHTWQYDYYHNAIFKQLDEGTRRAIQTIYLELPVHDDIYTSSMYIQSPDDGSNGFHPSADAVWSMITYSYIPMAKYLIRQGRAPGCPTLADGSADFTYCHAADAGLVGAKWIPSDADLDTAGVLKSIPAQRINWGKVIGAREQLDAGQYKLVYRVQNFGTSAANYNVKLTLNLWHCSDPDSCFGTLKGIGTNSHALAIREAENDSFTLTFNDPNYKAGDWYEAILEVMPAGGGSDGLPYNDKKVFKFTVMPRLYLPLIGRN